MTRSPVTSSAVFVTSRSLELYWRSLPLDQPCKMRNESKSICTPSFRYSRSVRSKRYSRLDTRAREWPHDSEPGRPVGGAGVRSGGADAVRPVANPVVLAALAPSSIPLAGPFTHACHAGLAGRLRSGAQRFQTAYTTSEEDESCLGKS
jgi:hypothetical protein